MLHKLYIMTKWVVTNLQIEYPERCRGDSVFAQQWVM